jgi:hypothetical protein
VKLDGEIGLNSKVSQRDPLPDNFDSLEEFWGFWDRHSTADYEDLMDDVNVQIDLRSRKIYCAVAKDVIVSFVNIECLGKYL